MLVLPIPDPNKPEQHDPWCPLGKHFGLRKLFIINRMKGSDIVKR